MFCGAVTLQAFLDESKIQFFEYYVPGQYTGKWLFPIADPQTHARSPEKRIQTSAPTQMVQGSSVT